MPTKNNNIIKYNQGEKSIKLPFVIYADLECLLEKMSTCQSNPNESSTTEINKHTPSGHLLKESILKNTWIINLNMENIEGIVYRHGNNVFKIFKLKNLGEYHDLYVQSDTLLLADVFENFRNKCLELYELDPAHFLSLPGLAWQVCLKKTNVELELLTDYDMLLMVEEGIRGGICHSIHRYAKANNYIFNI